LDPLPSRLPSASGCRLAAPSFLRLQAGQCKARLAMRCSPPNLITLPYSVVVVHSRTIPIPDTIPNFGNPPCFRTETACWVTAAVICGAPDGQDDRASIHILKAMESHILETGASLFRRWCLVCGHPPKVTLGAASRINPMQRRSIHISKSWSCYCFCLQLLLLVFGCYCCTHARSQICLQRVEACAVRAASSGETDPKASWLEVKLMSTQLVHLKSRTGPQMDERPSRLTAAG